LPTRVIKVNIRAFMIRVVPEREQLYSRMKRLLQRAETLANTHENVKIRLKAMEVVVRIAQFMEGVLKDVQLDQIQAELEQLEDTPS
jgi:REP element-mobilizing transposase RayT